MKFRVSLKSPISRFMLLILLVGIAWVMTAVYAPHPFLYEVVIAASVPLLAVVFVILPLRASAKRPE